MFQLLQKLVVFALLLGFDAFGLVLEFHSVVFLHFLNGLLLVLLQVLQLPVIVFLLGLEKQAHCELHCLLKVRNRVCVRERERLTFISWSKRLSI